MIIDDGEGMSLINFDCSFRDRFQWEFGFRASK